MLFQPPETRRQSRDIMRNMAEGKVDFATALEQLSEVGAEALICLIRGEDRKKAGDLDGAEWWFWKGVDLQPAQFTFYLSLAEVRRLRDPDDALAPRLVELALWKLSEAPEIPRAIAAHFREFIGSDDLDYQDPETYRMLATVTEVRRKDKEEPPEVLDRLLPYLLLNDLQLQAPGVVEYRVVREIQENAGRCEPLLWAALRDWANYPEHVQPEAVAMFVALLGEIGEVALLPDLMELATSSDPMVLLHANWAIWRLGQRFPEPALAVFLDTAPHASLPLRCAIAEQLALLPVELNIQKAAQALLNDFRGFAKRDDAPYLLLTVLFALGRRDDERVPVLMERYANMLPKRARAWMLEAVDAEEGFIPRLLAQAIDEIDIDDVCVDRALMDDEDDEEEDEDDEGEDEDDEGGLDDEDDLDYVDDEDDPPMPITAPPKPGRNDPCWCGSGKKYKKCHLAEDEAAASAALPAPKPSNRESLSENDNQAHKRLGNLVLSAVERWYPNSEMRTAFAQYFGPDPQGVKGDAETQDLFLQWYLHDHRPKTVGRTAFAEYLRREGAGSHLSSRERAMLESMRDARFGLFEVQRVEEGRGIEVRDVFRGDRFFIHDVSASKASVKWDCILTRVERFEDRYVFAGNGQMVARTILEQFKVFVETGSQGARQAPAEFVAANSHLFYRQMLAWHSERIAGIANNMGEPLELSTATYKMVGNEASVLAILNGIDGLRQNPDDLPGRHNFAWVEAGVEGPAKAFGDVAIAFDRLRLSCTSRQRLEIGRAMLEKALGKLVRHIEDRFETIEEVGRKAEREPPRKSPKRVDPELEDEVVFKVKSEHYANWVDEALPALAGKTPREAVRTEEGRLAVRDLIRGIENLEERERKEGRPALDLTNLRRTLGLTED